MKLASGLAIASIATSVAACGGLFEEKPAAEPRPAGDPAPPSEPPAPAAAKPAGDGGGGLAKQVAEVREEIESTPASSWSTYQGDVQRTGWARDAPAIRSPRIRWKTRVGIQGYLNAPLVLDGLVVVPSSGTRHNAPDASDGLHALDLRTGKSRWHATSGLDANGATVVGDLVVFTSDDGQVRAVGREGGTQRWSVTRVGAVYSTPLALGSTVVVGDSRGTVVALDGETGTVAWENRYAGAIRGGLASDGETIFVVSQGGDVAAIDASGRERWRKAVTRPGWDGVGTAAIEGYNAPVVDGARLIVPFARDTYYETGPALLALSVVDGHEQWRAKPGPSAEHWGNLRSSPAVADGVLVWAEPYSGDVAALDTSTGIVRYRVTVGDCLFPQYGSPAIAGQTAYVPRQDGHLYALDVGAGTVRWTMQLGESSTAGPVPVRSPGTGCDWEEPSGSPLYAPPAIAGDGTVVIGTGEGVVFSIEESEPAGASAR